MITLALNKSLVDEGEPLIYIIRLNKTKSCNKSSDIIGDKIIIHFKSSSSKYLALNGNIKWSNAWWNPHIIIWLEISSLCSIDSWHKFSEFFFIFFLSLYI